MSWAISRARLSGRASIAVLPPVWRTVRYVSLNSAIGRGIRKQDSDTAHDRRSFQREDKHHFDKNYYRQGDRPGVDRRDRRPSFDRGDRKPSFDRGDRKPSFDRGDRRDRGDRGDRGDRNFSFDKRPHMERRTKGDFDADEFVRSGKFRGLPPSHQASGESRWDHEERYPRYARQDNSKDFPKASNSRAHRITDGMPERVKDNVKVPDSVPYTTPASEFIYGTGAVEAALRCSRRQLYKLYLYQASGEELSPVKVSLRKLALLKNLEVKMAFAGWDRLLDKMSGSRPHNGCILEASPLPKLPVQGFHFVSGVTESHFRVELAPQSREEAAINGTNDRIPILQPQVSETGEPNNRYPVVLLLDGVVDTGNMGAIIRSAYFLGIDAIVFAGRNSAPLSPMTIKTSAGAAENMPLLHVKNEVDFIQRCQKNGWRFYAADAPSPGATYLDRLPADTKQDDKSLPILQSPSVLMMGSEATGLASHIKSHADAVVSIPGARHSIELGVRSDPARIDSLNVSVAAALLMEMFLRTPLGLSRPNQKGRSKMW